MISDANVHGTAAAPPSNVTMPMQRRHHMMMHMTFFWGKNTEILFHGWPGYDRLWMYLLSLLVVFAFAIAAEWLTSAAGVLGKSSDGWAARVLRTASYAARTGFGYLVMLAVMSFNGGVFVAAVAGHSVGFFFFGSRAATKRPAVCGC
ncbi:copper transporter 6-like [Andrographis paniculata]|uniref:copper transporter 6-like n=1 Tax=Andrographis paniculata TaxID=175694 RepID=UPI0021E76C97|nr:copper transporter 6-like [Andrographis paniculata]